MNVTQYKHLKFLTSVDSLILTNSFTCLGYIGISLRTIVRLWVCVCVAMGVDMCAYVCVCVYKSVYVFLCICKYMHAHLNENNERACKGVCERELP